MLGRNCEDQKIHFRCCVVGSINRWLFSSRPALGVERLDNVRFAEVDGQELFLIFIFRDLAVRTGGLHTWWGLERWK